MDQAVDYGVCDDRVGERLAPFRRRLVGGRGGRLPLVAGGHGLERQPGHRLAGGEVAYLVDYQQPVFVQALYRRLLPPLSQGAAQPGDEVPEADEAGGGVRFGRLDAERDGQVGLPQPLRAGERLM